MNLLYELGMDYNLDHVDLGRIAVFFGMFYSE